VRAKELFKPRRGPQTELTQPAGLSAGRDKLLKQAAASQRPAPATTSTAASTVVDGRRPPVRLPPKPQAPPISQWVDQLASSVGDTSSAIEASERRTIIADNKIWAEQLLRRSARSAKYVMEAREEGAA
jgi:hypothetical protein